MKNFEIIIRRTNRTDKSDGQIRRTKLIKSKDSCNSLILKKKSRKALYVSKDGMTDKDVEF